VRIANMSNTEHVQPVNSGPQSQTLENTAEVAVCTVRLRPLTLEVRRQIDTLLVFWPPKVAHSLKPLSCSTHLQPGDETHANYYGLGNLSRRGAAWEERGAVRVQAPREPACMVAREVGVAPLRRPSVMPASGISMAGHPHQ
jgi:hypothetical protein